MLPRPGRPARPAFTVIELLVVIGIIAVILSLASSAVMAIIRAQQKSTTEGNIRKVNGALQNAIRAALDQAKEVPIPASVMAIAGGDPERAKVIWQKLQIKRNFPMTYAEALAPWNFTGNTAMPKGNPLTAADLPPLQQFVDGLKQVPVAQFGVNPQAEMAALLEMTLRVNRRGSSFSVEQDLDVTALSDTNGDGVREVVDLWGQPLGFYRFPTDFADVDASATVSPSAGPRRDPQDPAGKLLDVNWNNQTQYAAQGGVYWFEQLCHLVHDPNQAQWTPRAWYQVPVVVSTGPNKRLGLLFTYTPGYYTPGNPPTGSPNWGMFPDPTDLAGANDNIFSYSLK